MSLVVTKGMGEIGDGSFSALVTTMGYGDTTGSSYPTCLAFLALSLTPSLTVLDLAMSSNFTITGPAAVPSGYSIEALDGGAPVTVLSVARSGPHLLIYTSEHTNGKNYRLHMPELGLVDVSDNPFNGPFEIDYVGVGVAPYALVARSIDARLLEITFDEPVNPDTAVVVANYSINHGLTVSSVYRLTDTTYRLVTSRQTQGTVYTVTITNVTDAGGNPV